MEKKKRKEKEGSVLLKKEVSSVPRIGNDQDVVIRLGHIFCGAVWRSMLPGGIAAFHFGFSNWGVEGGRHGADIAMR